MSEKTLRLENARDLVCAAADAYCFDPTAETEAALRHALAYWRSALGQARLAASNTGTEQK